jgi:hypothetical protein
VWPFRRTKPARAGSVELADLSLDSEDYSVFTVGQSRLAGSFAALGCADGDEPRFAMALLVPVVDPAMQSIADVEIRVDGHVVGYLRPPALTRAISVLDDHHADSIIVPVMIVSTPAGPDVLVHSGLL